MTEKTATGEYHKYSHQRSCKENSMSRFQQGSLLKQKRKSGPDVWVFRWYDETNGTRTYKKRILGNSDRYAATPGCGKGRGRLSRQHQRRGKSPTNGL